MDKELYEESYDSEGEVGPLPDPEYHNEETPGEDTKKQAAEGSVQASVFYTLLSEADIKKMKVTDLRDDMHKRKKSVKGKKDELMQTQPWAQAHLKLSEFDLKKLWMQIHHAWFLSSVLKFVLEIWASLSINPFLTRTFACI